MKFLAKQFEDAANAVADKSYKVDLNLLPFF